MGPPDGAPPATVVFIGGGGAGKSSLVAHVLQKLGAMDQRVVEQAERDGLELKQRAVKFAWVGRGGRAMGHLPAHGRMDFDPS
jgi:translation elongation factor EF-1alpha